MSRAYLDKNPHAVAAMFDGIAERYDVTNALLSGGQDRHWRRQVVRALKPQAGERILDLAAGTGASSIPLHDAGAEVVPCDFSVGMLTEGKRRHPELPFVAGDAMNLPFADRTFDAVTISFGLRNVTDPSAALQEMLRVTKPGGRLLICEFSTPTFGPWRAVYERYLMTALPRVAGFVTRDEGSYKYLAESIRDWPEQRVLGRRLVATGWHSVGYRNLTGGIVALHRATRPVIDPSELSRSDASAAVAGTEAPTAP